MSGAELTAYEATEAALAAHLRAVRAAIRKLRAPAKRARAREQMELPGVCPVLVSAEPRDIATTAGTLDVFVLREAGDTLWRRMDRTSESAPEQWRWLVAMADAGQQAGTEARWYQRDALHRHHVCAPKKRAKAKAPKKRAKAKRGRK
jgi:hypothetical protein